MRRRAELVDETRQRIVEATARLHTTVGPANTTIAAIAAEADVTRLTVYRHFPDLETLFVACRAHWRATHPGPDPATWAEEPDLGARSRRAFRELYDWYARNGADLFPIYRDLPAAPAVQREATAAQNARLADAIVGPVGRDANERRRAVAGHFVRFWAWHSLTQEQGLPTTEAAELAAELVVAAGTGPRARRAAVRRAAR
jgi:AcrR family transcriptional regulator